MTPKTTAAPLAARKRNRAMRTVLQIADAAEADLAQAVLRSDVQEVIERNRVLTVLHGRLNGETVVRCDDVGDATERARWWQKLRAQAAKVSMRPVHSGPYITKYERAVILGHRALQLASGSPPLMETSAVDYLEIAGQELDAGVLPVRLRRAMADGVTAEYVTVQQLRSPMCGVVLSPDEYEDIELYI